MKKILVLAEKPSVGKDIARVLNCNLDKNGYIEGEKYIVTWAFGHLVTLAPPENYDEKYKSWKIEDLPMLPDKLKLVTINKTYKQFSTVKRLMNRTDVTEIVIATDAGREGELVARWIIEKARVKKSIKRLWISSVTDKAIKDGFNNLKPGKNYENLYKSAIARAESDWLVGINATRALTCKYNSSLSCGRVQTPTLFMILNRENEIRNFKSKDFYGIKAVINDVEFIWQDSKTKNTNIFDKEKCDSVINSINNKKAKVIGVVKKRKKSFAPSLYNLTDLQADANKIYSYSAKETLSIMQKLYEQHKLLTYPRTDSRYISEDIVDTLKDRVKACRVGKYSKIAFNILKKDIKANKTFVDDSKVSDHHAIIPTEESSGFASLTDKEFKIYDLVVKRFLAVLNKPFEYESITIKVEIGKELFTAKTKRVLSLGWKQVYEDTESEENVVNSFLSNLNEGDEFDLSNIYQTKGHTNPPSRFNEGSLLIAMENPKKYMFDENKELIKTIEETGGLGTVATRADIIEKLYNNFLIEKKGRYIHITSKGEQLLDLVPNDLKSPLLTAKWEQKLALISKGKLKKDNFTNEMRNYTNIIVKEIKNSDNKFKHENITRNKCPECGKYMLEVNSKHGKKLVCQDRECGYRQNISKKTNARCPNCFKKLELRGQGEGKTFVCKCGHREKLSKFNERKKSEGKKVNKKDVNKYLKKQKKENEQGLNSALAEALAKFKK
ncbi:MAG: DNA topoisomerase III [Tepidibacter sp.]|jgi:DNA topoisomerase-3|uniref:DNA topoisomerase III n=1 Tax=Tepidibacter sp. TaxID=2529387 RepID=UPI0025E0E0A2|nr:DNA topoisomerase III [Tepidibacter sp.]MCT4508192.1 DNA topoisomerase III [Tepidibacter sp.]